MRDLIRKLTSFVLVAGLLAATSGEAFGYRRACTHHEAMAAASSTTDAGSHHDHGAQAGDEEGHDSPCSCLGNCTVSPPSPAPALHGAEGVLPAPANTFTVRATPIVPVVQVRISHLIPFPNAPPLV